MKDGASDSSNSWFKRFLLPGLGVKAVVIGGGYATGRELAWRPGEVTMIVGITAFVLILLNGIILGRPGGQNPHNVEIALQTRELNPRQRVVVRLSDTHLAQTLREAANVRFALSIPTLAALALGG